MAWVRLSDDAATYPSFLRIDEHDEWDARLKCEMFGFVAQCASLAAQHYTDYVISLGTARLVAGARAEALLRIAEDCELVTSVEVDGRNQWKLLDDENFVHMISKEERDRNNQRKRDLSDRNLTTPVRHRDGDQCRYCGVVVNWGDRKGGRGGTYDHREGVNGNASVENVVVACRSCNAERGNDADADSRVPLREAPAEPFYKSKTAEWINQSEWAQGLGITVTASSSPSEALPRQRPASQAGTAHRPGIAHQSVSDRAAHQRPDSQSGTAQRPDSQSGTAQRPASQAGTAQRRGIARQQGDSDPDQCIGGEATQRLSRTDLADLTDPARSWQIREGESSVRPGSGRDGPGRAGTGRDGPQVSSGVGEGSGLLEARSSGRRSRGRRSRGKR